MSKLNDEIRGLIDAMYPERARELIREAIKDANADTYYLASKVALDDNQRKQFLQKALDLDPFHEVAYRELQALNPSTPPPAPPPLQIVQVQAPPPPAPVPTTPPPQAVIQATPVPPPPPAYATMDANTGTMWRMAFNRLGYKAPNTGISRDYQSIATSFGLSRWDSADETVIIHVGIGKNLQANILAKLVSIQPKKGYSTVLSRGELVITNKRILALKPGGIFGGSNEGGEGLLGGMRRFEPIQKRGVTECYLYGDLCSVQINMNFVNQWAVALQTLQVVNSFSGKTASNSTTWLDYAKRTKSERSTNELVGQLVSNSRTLEQLFYQFMFFICSG